jgi:hypothetical protein
MGGASRNLIGSVTVLLAVTAALGMSSSHPWIAAGLGILAVLRFVVLVRQWKLGQAQKSRRRPAGSGWEGPEATRPTSGDGGGPQVSGGRGPGDSTAG